MSPKQATVRFSAKGNNRNANQCTIYQTGKNPADQKNFFNPQVDVALARKPGLQFALDN